MWRRFPLNKEQLPAFVPCACWPRSARIYRGKYLSIAATMFARLTGFALWTMGFRFGQWPVTAIHLTRA